MIICVNETEETLLKKYAATTEKLKISSYSHENKASKQSFVYNTDALNQELNEIKACLIKKNPEKYTDEFFNEYKSSYIKIIGADYFSGEFK